MLSVLAVEVLAWGEDVDAAKRVEGEEVLIAGEYEVGVTGDGEGEEFVVFGIAAGGDWWDAFDHHGGILQGFVKGQPSIATNIFVKLRAQDHGFQFLQSFEGYKQVRLLWLVEPPVRGRSRGKRDG